MDSASRMAVAFGLALCAGCFRPQNDLHGQCGSDADCSAGARCDKTQSPPVCVAATCNPACDSTSACDLQSVTCKPVSQASVVVTSPAANGFIGSRVQMAATARAPGGATGVTFQVRNAAGVLIGTGSGSAAPGSAEFGATLTIGGTGLADGGATVTALLAYPGGSLTSAAVPVTIDVTPPVLQGVQVFLAGDPVPTAAGVTYPTQPPGATNGFLSGHDGTQFILNDQIHIRGTVTDGGAGLSCASLQYRIDGVDRNGATVRGPTTQPLPGCSADGTKSVAFDLSGVAINDLTKYGPLGAGTGNLQLVILASDRTSGAPNAIAESPISIKTTRLWWSRRFTVSPPATLAVSGLAVHANGNLIVTNDAPAGNGTVVALHEDGPFHVGSGEDWTAFGGSVVGAPTIGLGTNPRIYVASKSDQNIAALNAGGSAAWSTGILGNFTGSPAVTQGVQISSIVGCEAVVAGADNFFYAACQDTTNPARIASTFVDLTDTVLNAPVTVGGGSIFIGTDKSIAQTFFRTAGTTGILNAAVRFAPGGAGPFTGALPSANGPIFATAVTNHSMYGVTFASGQASLSFNPPTDIRAAPIGMPIFATQTLMRFGTADAKFHGMNTSGVDNVFAAIPTPAGAPLLGHDGNTYVGTDTGIAVVDATGTTSWSLSALGKVTAPLALNCNGTLYAAAGDSVYAVVTDMMSDPNNAGLADTPWPKFQRDSRNTGNADIPTKFGVRTAPGAGGCIQ